MSVYRDELIDRRIDIFRRVNGVLHELARHYKLGLLDKENAKIISAMFTKTVSISPNEFVYLVKCLKEDIDQYIESKDERMWTEVKSVAHEITMCILRIQYFVDALLIEAESSSDSIMAKLEFRRVYGKLISGLLEDMYEWCYEFKHEGKIL